MKKERIDKLLFERGLADSRSKAQAMVMAGVVLVDEKRAEKARKARFDALLLERWQARQANKEKGHAEI